MTTGATCWRVTYLLIFCTSFANSAFAGSFTFDFTDPSGLGINHSDAVSLNSVGAVRDSAGRPIGFTQLNRGVGTNAGQTEVATLTENGLRVQLTSVTGDNQPDAFLAGIPFPTTGFNPVSIVARFHSLSREQLNVTYEQAGIGWGPANAFAVNDLLLALTVFNVGNDQVQTRFKNDIGTEQFTAWPNQAGAENLSRMSLQALPLPGSSLVGEFLFSNDALAVHSNTFDSLSTPLLGQSTTYGFFVVDLSLEFGGEHSLDMTLSSITFSGDDLTAPVIVPEPSGMVFGIVGSTLLGIFLCRKRRVAAAIASPRIATLLQN